MNIDERKRIERLEERMKQLEGQHQPAPAKPTHQFREGQWVVIEGSRGGFPLLGIYPGTAYKIASIDYHRHDSGLLAFEGHEAIGYIHPNHFRAATADEIARAEKPAPFKVGETVICVDECKGQVTVGNRYTVTGNLGDAGSPHHISVRENNGTERAWLASRFRALTAAERAASQTEEIKCGDIVVIHGDKRPCIVKQVYQTYENGPKQYDLHDEIYGGISRGMSRTSFRLATPEERTAYYLGETKEREIKVGDWVIGKRHDEVLMYPFVPSEVRNIGSGYCHFERHGALLTSSLRHATPAEIAAHLGVSITVNGTTYKAEYHKGYVQFGCAKIDNRDISWCHYAFHGYHSGPNPDANRKIVSINIGAGVFTKDILDKLVPNLIY